MRVLSIVILMLWTMVFLNAIDDEFKVTRKPEMMNLDEIKVIGLNTLVSSNYNVIGHQWERFMERQDEIQNPLYPDVGVGITFDVRRMSDEQNAEYYFYHLVGAPVEGFDSIPQGMTWFVIPAGDYARFVHQDDISTLDKTYGYIYETWFPDSEYEYDNERVEFEWYDENFQPESEDSEFYIYVPVMKLNENEPAQE